MNMELLQSGKTTFKLEVPFRLYEQGEPGPKPLMIYLHDYDQDIVRFEQQMSPLLALTGYHLFIQAPYADHRIIPSREHSSVEQRGYAWYLDHGHRGSLEKSLEYSSEFIQGVVDARLPYLKVTRCAVIGFEMGATQAGYFGFTRWKHTNELIMIGGRFYQEWFEERDWSKRASIHLYSCLPDHPTQYAQPQEIALLKARESGLNVVIEKINPPESLLKQSLVLTHQWLCSLGYTNSNVN